MKHIFSNLLILFGVAFILSAGYLLYLRHSPNTLSFNYSIPVGVTKEGNLPTKIIISSINLNLSVIPAVISNNNWQTTNKGISFLKTSALPGEKGNSVMYGHNWTSLLGNLKEVKPGETIEVIMSNGSKKRFTVEYTAVVTPDQTHIIEQTSDTRITLYTCAGFLDSKRFVVVAKTI